MNQGWIYREQVDRAGAGLSLLAYYTQRYRHSSQAEWQARIALGQILLAGKPALAETLLEAGQQLAYHRLPWEEPEVPSFEVLYEDSDLLVVSKPAGLPVLPGGGFLEHTLLHQIQHHYPQETPVPIHRLGRGTSGLLLMARSPLARASLSQQMRKNTLCPPPERQTERPIRKIYRALVKSGDLPDRFTLTDPIGKVFHPVLGYLYAATPEGRFAHSECLVLKRNGATTLLEVSILTGRPHQIRIHLATAGYPLVGDPLYGVGGVPLLQGAIASDKLPVPGDCGYHLHAYSLSLTHPRTKQPLSFVCPAPAALEI